MSLIDIAARTATREELVELLASTEAERQRYRLALEAIVEYAPKEEPIPEWGDCIAEARWAEWNLAGYARDALAKQ
jgi:hypothetical protein